MGASSVAAVLWGREQWTWSRRGARLATTSQLTNYSAHGGREEEEWYRISDGGVFFLAVQYCIVVDIRDLARMEKLQSAQSINSPMLFRANARMREVPAQL